ncbi:MurR/RpiR family transcriptional regulator [Mycoplasma sp. NEAQ87857]|uniref:MurR/RpiR family transcriptional regulator n=1 Tax=Mycoplasma sp. NEAQ87857 TaxID=2683967 RepID=UPI00131AA063|nr:hypothetical protein [Mycoplasma sp. NEAQ87857]
MRKYSIIEESKIKKLKRNDTNQYLLDYIENNTEEFLLQSTASLAEILYTSQPTVSRFAKNLGFDSFRSLQIYVAQRNIADQDRIRDLDKNETVLLTEVLRQVNAHYKHSINTTVDLYKDNTSKNIHQYINDIVQKHNLILGMNECKMAASYFAKNLNKIGICSFEVCSMYEFFASEFFLNKTKSHITIITDDVQSREITKVIEHIENKGLTYSLWTLKKYKDFKSKATSTLYFDAYCSSFDVISIGIKIAPLLLSDILLGWILWNHKNKDEVLISMQQQLEKLSR